MAEDYRERRNEGRTFPYFLFPCSHSRQSQPLHNVFQHVSLGSLGIHSLATLAALIQKTTLDTEINGF
jgi:hypothetical protein